MRSLRAFAIRIFSEDGLVSPTSRKIDIRSRGENRTNFPSLETEDFRWDEFLWMENERAEEGKSPRSVGRFERTESRFGLARKWRDT